MICISLVQGYFTFGLVNYFIYTLDYKSPFQKAHIKNHSFGAQISSDSFFIRVKFCKIQVNFYASPNKVF